MSDDSGIQIPLNKGYIAIVDEDDAVLAAFNWFVDKKKNTHYAKRNIGSRSNHISMYLHRNVMERVLGRPLAKGEVVDHINHNGLDNRRSNVRLATQSQNMANQYLSDRNKSGFKGVRWDSDRQRWATSIGVNGEVVHLGRFTSLHAAIVAYNEAATQYFGEYAVLNVIPSDLDEAAYRPTLRPQKPRSKPPKSTSRKGLQKNNKSGFKGVSWRGSSQKWAASISINGKQKHLGVFTDIRKAAQAYNDAAIAYLGEQAILNEIPTDV